MFERLKAAREVANQKTELKKLIADCDELIKEPGQSVSVGIASRALNRYQKLDFGSRSEFYSQLATRYEPNIEHITRALDSHKEKRSPESLIELVRAVEPPRQELLRRLNRVPLVPQSSSGCAKRSSTPCARPQH